MVPVGYLVPLFLIFATNHAMSEAASEKNTVLMEKIVSLCKRRGFICQ